ncbi:hypothetical protein [Neobacillus drentensis]|uniref:hypothetical protein n=1 Tax=Neobacillus drentensis TaxID=220684 RepID=UPI0030013E2E
MNRNKIIKSVSFNVMNEQDRAYLERIQDANFSGYVKRLIEKDIRQRKVIKADSTSLQPSKSGGPVIIRSNGLSLKSV